MDKSSTVAAFRKAGLTALIPYSDTLLQPTLRLYATPTPDDEITSGISKLGGLPDLPADLQWPTLRGLPLSFLAQIRLSDLQQFGFAHRLPALGLLWFFYDAKQQTYGEESGDAAGWRVLYHPTTRLKRASLPPRLPRSAYFHAATLTFAPELSLAQQPQLELPSLTWSDDDQERYDTIYEQFYQEANQQAPRHQLLGSPYTLQDDMREQCQFVTHNVTDGNDPRADELAKGDRDWHLLLQIDSDDRLGMRWGSEGMLYYWIKENDLAAQRFNQTWMIMQSE
jgi:Uncharacterized protein conserved in bacteria